MKFEITERAKQFIRDEGLVGKNVRFYARRKV